MEEHKPIPFTYVPVQAGTLSGFHVEALKTYTILFGILNM